jgi:uncharacterized protein YndB with AHSA1/START domain
MRFTHRVEIRATAEAVFPWIEDPERGKQWAAGVTGGEITHSTPGRVGTTFREVLGREGRTLEMQGVITGYVAPKRFAVHLESSRHTADVCFTLTRLPGATLLTRELDLRLKGWMRYASLLLRPLLARSINRETEQEFATLKRLCETPTPPPGHAAP